MTTDLAALLGTMDALSDPGPFGGTSYANQADWLREHRAELLTALGGACIASASGSGTTTLTNVTAHCEEVWTFEAAS